MINRKQTYPLIALLFLLTSHICIAHNKVVVIPMAGDDVPADSTPTTPVADANTNEDDYRLTLRRLIDGSFLGAFDKTTGLTWQRSGSSQTLSWVNAVNYCQDLTILTTIDWRLPTVVELQSIVDYGNNNPAIVESIFDVDLGTSRYWSSTTVSTNPEAAWFVDFSPYGTVGIQSKAVQQSVRCVR